MWGQITQQSAGLTLPSRMTGGVSLMSKFDSDSSSARTAEGRKIRSERAWRKCSSPRFLRQPGCQARDVRLTRGFASYPRRHSVVEFDGAARPRAPQLRQRLDEVFGPFPATGEVGETAGRTHASSLGERHTVDSNERGGWIALKSASFRTLAGSGCGPKPVRFLDLGRAAKLSPWRENRTSEERGLS